MIHPELHRYQRGVIFSFVISLAIFVLYVSLLPQLNPQWEQTAGLVWLALFSLYCLYLRSRVPAKDGVNEHKRPLLHWVILGMTLLYFNVVKPSEFQFLFPIVNLGFILFTLFSADAHWDFQKFKT